MKYARILVPVLVAALLLNLPVNGMAAAYAGESCGDNAVWRIENNTLILSGSGAVTAAPWYDYHRYSFENAVICQGITSLSEGIFRHCQNLKQVTVAASVTSFGAECFSGCDRLQKITYEGALTQWQKISFADTACPLFRAQLNCTDGSYQLCGAYQYWTLDADGMLRITGTGAMSDFSPALPAPWQGLSDAVKKVVIGEGITTIGSYAFYNLDTWMPYAMTTVTVPRSVGSIGTMAFSDCTQLTDVYYADTFQNWKRLTTGDFNEMLQSVTLHCTDRSLSMCGQATIWELDSRGTLTISGQGPTANWNGYTRPPWHPLRMDIKKVVVSSGVTHLGSHAFWGAYVKEVTLANTVTSVGNYAFEESLLEEISPGTRLALLGEGAFDGCDRLRAVTFPNTLKRVGRFAFRNCTDLKKAGLGNAVTSLGKEAFLGCAALEEMVLADDITEIDECTFLDCKSMTRVKLPANLKTLGDGAFQGCTSLREIDLPDSVTEVGSSAFRDCKGLTQLSIPAKVTGFAPDAARGCSALKAFRVDSSNPCYASDSAGVLFNRNQTTLLRAPEALSGSYVIPATVTDMESSAFSGCALVTRITVPDGVTRLSDSVFYDCLGLEAVTLGKKLTYIGSCAFMGCSSLAEVTLPETLHTIEQQAFYSCESLKSVNLHHNITYIGSSAFTFCKALETFQWPKGCDTIREFTFGYCYSLKEADLPNTVTAVEYGAFYQCIHLTRFTVPAGVTEFDSGVLAFCGKLTDLRVDPANPSYCADSRGVLFTKDKTTLLYAPGGLSGVYEIPEGTVTVTSLGISRCNQLTELIIPASVTQMENWAIYNNEALSAIRVAEENACFSSDEKGVLFNKDKTILITAPDNLSGHYRVPESVSVIQPDAFRFTGLTSVYLPDGLTRICRAAFAETPLKQVFYGGNKDRWKGMEIEDGNQGLTKATVCYESGSNYDLNRDGVLDKEDAVYLLLHTMFGEAFYPLLGAAADADGNGVTDLDDAVYLLLHTMFGEEFYPLKKE